MDVYGHSALCPFQYYGPTSYAAGGEAQAAKVFKLGVIEWVPPFLGVPADGLHAVVYHYNLTTNKMMAFFDAGANAALKEVTDGTDLSTYIGNGVAFGKG
jgi:hypothetical protein